MGLVRNELMWGVTHEPTEPRAPGAREWKVEVESEPLGSFDLEAALSRFAYDASLRAPTSQPTCTLTRGRFGMTVTVIAHGADEAARHGRRLFESALEAALWPRSELVTETHFDVFVGPAAVADAA